MTVIKQWFGTGPWSFRQAASSAPLLNWNFNQPAGSTLLRTLAYVDCYTLQDDPTFPGRLPTDVVLAIYQATNTNDPNDIPISAPDPSGDWLHYDMLEWTADFGLVSGGGAQLQYHAPYRVDTPAQRKLLGGGSVGLLSMGQMPVAEGDDTNFNREVYGTIVIRQLWEHVI